MSTTRTLLSRPADLADVVSRLVSRPHQWMDRVRLLHDRRWYERLELHADYDVWLLSWLPGQGTGFHDHGGSSGAFAVAVGSLQEHRPGEEPSTLQAHGVRAFGPRYVHDVRNESPAPAVSIHVYSPPLTDMNHYALDAGELRPLAANTRPPGDVAGALQPCLPDVPRRHGIDDAVAAARRRFGRVGPAEAHMEAQESGAVLIDIRPVAQRAREGIVPGALVIERNVLEWRLDPGSNARLAIVNGYDLRPMLLCSEGYASSLAAASLLDLGLWRATDVIGGFRAWCDAGLPTARLTDAALPAFETRGEEYGGLRQL
jgi:rhodanese-related sulfurtransferase/predicted metal-dependent enzyme (double-stranded beta helix superfamily)